MAKRPQHFHAGSPRGARGRAGAHGFRFVDPRGAFSPHEICSSSEWLNGLSNPISESYHPNVSGQQEYTNEVDPQIG